jgi:hypothetical protein
MVSLNCLSIRARAQHTKVPKEPFKVVDAFTGKTIPEILVIPRYSSGIGVFIAPEGPAKSTNCIYLDNPFVYRTGEPFVITQPSVFTGLPLLFVFIGEVRDLEGILVVTPGYRPLWTDDLWWYPGYPDYKRKLRLTPISDSQWSRLLEKELSPFVNDASRINDDCQIWNLPEHCNLTIQYDEEERKRVRSFLQQAKRTNKVSCRRKLPNKRLQLTRCHDVS